MRSEQDNGGGEGGQPPPAANFGLSGVLAAETNTVNGVEAKYNEPMNEFHGSKNTKTARARSLGATCSEAKHHE